MQSVRYALTELLRAYGSKTVTDPETHSPLTRQELLARKVWDLVLYGRVELLDSKGEGFVLEFGSIQEWVSAVKWLYDRLDGTPPHSGTLHLKGPMQVRFVWDDGVPAEPESDSSTDLEGSPTEPKAPETGAGGEGDLGEAASSLEVEDVVEGADGEEGSVDGSGSEAPPPPQP